MCASESTTALGLLPAHQALAPSTSGYCGSEPVPAVTATDSRLLLSSIVHDFNNLLTPIVTILEELQARHVGTSRQLKKIDGAIYRAVLAKVLARQLLDFVNPRPVSPEPVQIRQLLEPLETALVSILSPNVRLKLDIAEEIPPAFIDRQLVERALLNLALNARDAMPEGGDVTILAALEFPPAFHPGGSERMIRLSVADCGLGMDDQTLKMTGQPDFSTRTNGTGLGLATVRRLMESLGGGLSIRSAPRRGTTIDLWMPAMLAFDVD
ncbi:ATP-binding protein [Rhizobium jaguaris]|uniref:histidine kinase n=1 Tax=Rhizobium jaguaris TaxID=1312183 RepID=A0A387FUE3_9HYPH|nr:ATP-binding protein [Rhizobium jaguaris]AYG62188.1 sensor/response regulator hybrid [Rhizobium jaguaris]